VSNAEIAETIGVRTNWIEARTGVRERRFVRDEDNAGLAARAAAEAIEAAGLAPGDVDTVIVATSTPDRPIPPTATRVQSLTGAGGALSLDVNAACAGFLYGIEVARSLLASGARHRYAVVVGSDTYSRLLNPADRGTYTIFGDGAGAAVLGRVPAGYGMLGTSLRTDGELGDIAVGGPCLPVTHDQLDSGAHYARMVGHRIAEIVREQFPLMLKEVLSEHRLAPADIDHLVSHQANPRLIRQVAADAGFSPEQLVVTGDSVGNTASGSVPIGLDTAVRDGRVRTGDTVLMVSFGAGMTWGWSLMKWSGGGRPAEAGTSPGDG